MRAQVRHENCTEANVQRVLEIENSTRALVERSIASDVRQILIEFDLDERSRSTQRQ